MFRFFKKPSAYKRELDYKMTKLNEELLEHLSDSVGHLIFESEKTGHRLSNERAVRKAVKKARLLLMEIEHFSSKNPTIFDMDKIRRQLDRIRLNSILIKGYSTIFPI